MSDLVNERYRLDGRLGSGGTGAVHAAFDERAERPVALKALETELPDEDDLIRAEFGLLARLHHDGIERVYDLDRVRSGPLPEGTSFFTAERIEGTDLKTAWAEAEEAGTLIGWLDRIAAALDHLHEADLIHNDLKPDHCLVLPDGSVKLIDFGLTAGPSGGHLRAGTLAYMAPEQLAGRSFDHRADLYALGATLYEVLAGRPPFTGESAAIVRGHLEEEPAPLAKTAPEAPRPFDRVVARLLRKNPQERYASARDAVDDLKEGTGHLRPPELHPLSHPPLVGRDAERGRLLAWLDQRTEGEGPTLLLLHGEKGVGKDRLAQEVRIEAQLAGLRWLEAVPERFDFSPEAHASGALLLVSDLDVADAETIRTFLQRVAALHQKSTSESPPFGILATATRLDGDLAKRLAVASELGQSETISLSGLDEPEVARLVARALHRDRVDESTVQTLQHLGGDNPEALLLSLQTLDREGCLRAEPDGLHIADIPPPEAVSGSVATKDLPPLSRTVLRAVAVQRRSTRVGVLEAALDETAEAVQGAVRHLMREGWLLAEGDRVRLRRAIFRGAILDEYPAGERLELASALADAVESDGPDRIELLLEAEREQEAISEALPLLEDPNRPAEWRLRLGRRLLDHLREKTGEQGATVCYTLGEAAIRADALDDARAFLETARELAEPALADRAAARLAHVAIRSGNLEEAEDLLEPGPDPETDDGEAPALHRLSRATLLLRRGRYEEAVDTSRGAPFESEDVTRRTRAAALNIQGLGLFYQASYHHALTPFRKALQLSREDGDAVQQAIILSNTALCHARAGDPDKAVRRLEKGLALAEEAGHENQAISCLINLARIDQSGGKREEARRRYRQALARAERRQAPLQIGLILNNLADSHLSDDEPTLALNCLDQAEGLLKLAGARAELAMVENNRAHALFLAGQLGKADEAVRRSIEMRRDLNDRSRLLYSLETGTAIAPLLGKEQDAVAWAEEARELARESEASGAREAGLLARLQADFWADFGDESLPEEARRHLESAGPGPGRVRLRLALARRGLETGSLAAPNPIRAAIEEAREGGWASLEGEGLLLLGRYQLEAGEHEEAFDASESAVRIAARIGHPPLLAAAAAALSARVLAARGRDAEAGHRWTQAERHLNPLLASGDEAALRRWLDLTEPVEAKTAEMPARSGHRVLLSVLKPVLRAGNDLQNLLNAALETTLQLLKAERGFLVLVDGDGRFSFKAARGMGHREIERPGEEISWTLVRRAAEAKETIRIADALADPSFNEAQSIRQLRIRSVVAAPITWEGTVIAVLYVEASETEPPFDAEDAGLLEELGHLMAGPLRNAFLYEKRTEELASVRRALSETVHLLGERYRLEELIGRSKPMQELFRLIERVAETDLPVVIQGESGTGKELVARAIHFSGPRKEKPFLAENCAAIPGDLLEAELFGHTRGAFTGATEARPGLFLAADGGTLLLDEIGEMPPAMQSKLLRVLQEKKVRPVGGQTTRSVDVRVLAATHRNLSRMVEEGSFREDLYYRLNVLPLQVPPLRDRSSDIPLLCEHFLRQAAERNEERPKKLKKAALQKLMAHSWPGNVRELRHVMERAHLLSDDTWIDVEALNIEPEETAQPLAPKEEKDPAPTTKAGSDTTEKEKRVRSIEEVEKEAIAIALERSPSKAEAARRLGINRRTLNRKIKKYKL